MFMFAFLVALVRLQVCAFLGALCVFRFANRELQVSFAGSWHFLSGNPPQACHRHSRHVNPLMRVIGTHALATLTGLSLTLTAGQTALGLSITHGNPFRLVIDTPAA